MECCAALFQKEMSLWASFQLEAEDKVLESKISNDKNFLVK